MAGHAQQIANLEAARMTKLHDRIFDAIKLVNIERTLIQAAVPHCQRKERPAKGSPHMAESMPRISSAFQTFMSEAPQHAHSWGGMVQGLAEASALDRKTASLAYLAVLAALRLESGIPFHVQAAKQAGATRGEVISAILIGLPAAGHGVTQALPEALTAFDAD